MDKTASTWSTPRELVQLVLAPQHLKRTLSVALIFGTVFVAMNQLGVILHGRTTAVAWLKLALTYLTPLLVSNFGLVSATRRPHLSSSPHNRGDEWKPQIPTNQQVLTTVKGIRQWMKRN